MLLVPGSCKNRRPYNLYCVGADVKPCSINQSINPGSCWTRRLQSSWRTGTMWLTTVLPFYYTATKFAKRFSTRWPSTRHRPTGICHHVIVTINVAISALFLAVNPCCGSRQRCQPMRTSLFSVSRTSVKLLLLPHCRPTAFCLPF